MYLSFCNTDTSFFGKFESIDRPFRDPVARPSNQCSGSASAKLRERNATGTHCWCKIQPVLHGVTTEQQGFVLAETRRNRPYPRSGLLSLSSRVILGIALTPILRKYFVRQITQEFASTGEILGVRSAVSEADEKFILTSDETKTGDPSRNRWDLFSRGAHLDTRVLP
ncbi:hypothetical protein OG21DRAFT_169194 [Imleria badia]|nr:hypothetical protein OG21DRAFT_169194 [Imleria badia]